MGAALAVEAKDEIHMFTGVNFELSQPTGRRCAEQIAIGSALARLGDELEFGQLKMLAVVAGQEVPKPAPSPLFPCGVCCEMLHKLNKANDQITLYMHSETNADQVVKIPFSHYYPPHVG